MEVSIGIMAYNEEKNIGKLLETLLNQNTKTVNIKEIIIVSSGSKDNTDQIVKEFCKKDKRIKLITQEKRKGKASAINEFLKIAKHDICILGSADIIPEKNCIEELCLPLKEEKIGIVSSRPMPKKGKGFLSFAVDLQWKLHHKLSLNNPKFGELIVFRKIINKIGKTAVDEEYLAMLIKYSGFKGAYAQKAIVYNHGPKIIRDFLIQRRRIYCGHLNLKKRRNYEVATMNNMRIIKELLKIIEIRKIISTMIAMILEGYARLLGTYDHYTNKNHYIWRIAETTKNSKKLN